MEVSSPNNHKSLQLLWILLCAQFYVIYWFRGTIWSWNKQKDICRPASSRGKCWRSSPAFRWIWPYYRCLYSKGICALRNGKWLLHTPTTILCFSEDSYLISVSYMIQDPKRTGHRGFGFVTFADEGVADLVSRRSHEICGQQVLSEVFWLFCCLIYSYDDMIN